MLSRCRSFLVTCALTALVLAGAALIPALSVPGSIEHHVAVFAARSASPVERFVTLSTGVQMEYVEQGNADGVPVIFLHGITDSWRSFEPVLRHLPGSIRAFAISARGHGNSSRPDAGYTHGDMANDLHAFMDAMHLTKAVVVGHSMGGMVAQRFAVDHQARLQRLVLVGAFSTHRAHPAVREFVESAIAPLSDPIDPAFVKEFQASTLAHPVPPEFFETVVRESLKVPARVWRAAFDAHLAAPDLSRKLKSMAVPTLLVWGDRDEYAVREDQDALLAAIPRARLLAIDGYGHAPHWEDPARFVRELVAFIGASQPTALLVQR